MSKAKAKETKVKVMAKDEEKKSAATAIMTVTDDVTTDGHKIVKVPLRLIRVNHAWNGRSLGDTMRLVTDEQSEEENKGIGGVQQMIAANGQDTPVTLRPNPDPKTAEKQPYDLVEGFRREVAIERIAAAGGAIAGQPDWNPLAPYIRAIIIPMTEAEAVNRNGRENIGRQNLSPPDVAFTIARIAKASGATDVQIAESLGKTQGYVSKLHRVAKFLVPAVFSDWRKAPIQLGVDDMLRVTKVGTDPERQMTEYTSIIKSKMKGGKKEGDDGEWFEKAKESAKRVGVLLGKLEGHMVIVVDDGEARFDHFDANLMHLVKLPAPKDGKDVVSNSQKAEIAKLAHAAYEAARKMAEAEERGETAPSTKGEGGEKKNAAKKGGAAKGATAN